MTKYIHRLFKFLWGEQVAAWLLVIVVVVLGEWDVIPKGMVLPHSQGEFELNTAAVLLTLSGIPVALRLFTLNTTRGLRRMNNEEALRTYHVWSVVRLAILVSVAVISLAIYYLSMSFCGVVCGLIAVSASIYCWPKKENLVSYLEGMNRE